MESKATFGLWDEAIHSSADQKKRIQSAQMSATTPTSIENRTMTGIFPGSGKDPYKTSLESCTCGDFTRRKLPCKHMYRLAMECGVFSGTFKTGVNKNTLESMQITLASAVSAVENLNDTDQCRIKDFLYESLYHDVTDFPVLANESDFLLHCSLLELVDTSESTALQLFKRNQIIAILDEHNIAGFKRNMSLGNLISWCIENISDVWSVFPRVYVLRFSSDFQKNRRGLYSYLLRKYDWDFYCDGEMRRFRYPHGAKFESVDITITIEPDGAHICNSYGNPNMCHFPDDEITTLLTLYGHNRCLNGYTATLCL